MEEPILVICVDRDNDIGEKLGVNGPIIGRKECLEVAKNLALEDPGETDANSLFGAIKEYDKLKEQGEKVYLAAFTGDKIVGTESDAKIVRQLEGVIKKYSIKKAVFVSDGAEDECLIPIIQSKLQILSVVKIVVRQSSQLESGYYVALNFFKDIVNDPQASKIVLGLPAITLVLYSLFGDLGWRVTLGVIGGYLMIKAFHMERFVISFVNELTATFSKDKVSFFCYILSLAFITIGLVQGYNNYNLYLNSNILVSGLSFVQGSLSYFFIAMLTLLTGKLLYIYGKSSEAIKYITYYALTFSIYVVLENSVQYIMFPEYNPLYLVISIVLGFLIIFIAMITERIAQME
ncbi:MAG: DUF373 family protein [Candidatus Aenigmarchaeota archaeon]|nr:DUF373 family protein [Candidatus Aenigmarchaeota archaeon]